MTVEVDRDALKGALAAVADVVAGRTTIPILSNLMIVAESGQLHLTGTDLDIEATAQIEAAGDLSTTVSKEKLVAAITSLKPGRLTIAPAATPGAITIKQGRSVRTLATLPVSDFPKREQLQGGTRFRLQGPALTRLIETTYSAQSVEEVRYYLCGILLHVREGHLVAAATDGHRLVRAETAAPEGCEAMPDSIVPSKTVTLLRKLLSKVDAEVSIALTERAILFEIGSIRVASKLIEGTYPDYQRTIPSLCGNVLTLQRDALIEPVEAVAAVVNPEGEQVKRRAVVFDLTKGDEHEISARDSAGSSASEAIDCTYEGDPIRFGLNQRYAVTIASIFSDNATLTLSISDPAAPIRVTSDKDPDVVAVMMPMRV